MSESHNRVVSTLGEAPRGVGVPVSCMFLGPRRGLSLYWAFLGLIGRFGEHTLEFPGKAGVWGGPTTCDRVL